MFCSNKMNFCDYKNAFGELKTGVHAERIDVFGLSLARNDVLATVGLGILLGIISGGILSITMDLKMSVWNTLLFWITNFLFCIFIAFMYGIFMHWLFCVKSELNKYVGM
jgi:hypothetical protein